MVKINEKYFISADSNNYILQEKSTVKDKESKNFGQDVYTSLGYYQSLEGVLNGVLKNETRLFLNKSEINSLIELKEYIKQLEKDIVIKENI